MTRISVAGVRYEVPALAPSPRAPEASAPTEGPSPFARLLRGLTAEVERGESLTRQAMSVAQRGPPGGPAELLGLQAGVCRYSEALDLAARLVDRSTTSVKTVLQGQ